jgi:hypothetical protein
VRGGSISGGVCGTTEPAFFVLDPEEVDVCTCAAGGVATVEPDGDEVASGFLDGSDVVELPLPREVVEGDRLDTLVAERSFDDLPPIYNLQVGVTGSQPPLRRASFRRLRSAASLCNKSAN